MVTVRVVATWLDLASQTAERPSFRDVAQRVGLSHTSVRNHWVRFRETRSPSRRKPTDRRFPKRADPAKYDDGVCPPAGHRACRGDVA